MELAIIILAAGKGTRMRSDLPKVLHTIGGLPMLSHVIDTARSLTENIFIIHGADVDKLKSHCPDPSLSWVPQYEQLGTGHAVLQVLPHIQSASRILVLYGDVPLITADSLKQLLAKVSSHQLGLLTVYQDNPIGLGRILRDDTGKMKGIVEERDANDAERQIKEVNTGIFLCPKESFSYLAQIDNKNNQGEYYLTDLVKLMVQDGHEVVSKQVDSVEVMGVNDRQQLASVERHYQRRVTDYFMQQGVTFRDPSRVDFRGRQSAFEFGRDVIVDIDVIFEGQVILGDGVSIGPFTHLKHCKLEADVAVYSHCVLEGCDVKQDAKIGPYARLRPGTTLGVGCKIGNFVETKQAMVGDAAKVNHLSYIGDAKIGVATNIGAGTITCNYDGERKHQTVIGDNVFVGSNTSLIAPVNIGDRATVGAGSVIRRDVNEETLAISRSPQKEVVDWYARHQTNEETLCVE